MKNSGKNKHFIMQAHYVKYKDETDYANNNPVKQNDFIKLDRSFVNKHAVNIGMFSGHVPTQTGVKMYEAISRVLFYGRGQLTLCPDYGNSEASVKASLSFFSGMIAAQIIAEKKTWNIKTISS